MLKHEVNVNEQYYRYLFMNAASKIAFILVRREIILHVNIILKGNNLVGNWDVSNIITADIRKQL